MELFMKTTNCALLTADVLIDTGKLLQSPSVCTPGEFHALNSLIEAAILHEKLYVYQNQSGGYGGLFDEFFKCDLIHSEDIADECGKELKARGLTDLADDVLIDRFWGTEYVNYTPDDLTEILSSLIEYEKTLGFSRMSKLLDTEGKDGFALFAARKLNFSEDDVNALESTFRKTRAFSVCAMELGFEFYTGLISRPFLIDLIGERRRDARELFHRMKLEFDDLDDTDLPTWRRIDIPVMTQVILDRCKDSPNALFHEIMKLREELRFFRQTLTSQSAQLNSAKTRGEKRKIRKETESAWESMIKKHDITPRLSHKLWDIAKEPLKIHVKIGDKMVEKDKLDQSISKVQGLTDLWTILSDAPSIEQNKVLVKKVFGVECNSELWQQTQTLARELESIMRKE